jgi:hypothetical protein
MSNRIAIDEVLNKLVLADKASKGYDNKSLLVLFSPPTTVILVLHANQ